MRRFILWVCLLFAGTNQVLAADDLVQQAFQDGSRYLESKGFGPVEAKNVTYFSLLILAFTNCEPSKDWNSKVVDVGSKLMDRAAMPSQAFTKASDEVAKWMAERDLEPSFGGERLLAFCRDAEKMFSAVPD